MKVDKIKIPFIPERFEYNNKPTLEEVSYLESLAKENKIKELEEYVNRKMVGNELSTFNPGLPTRDYLGSALHQLVLKRYPELKEMSNLEKVDFLKNKVYPGLDDLKKSFNLSNNIKVNPNEGSLYRPSTSKRGPAGEVNIDPYAESFIDDTLHEVAHSVDDPIKTLLKNRSRYGDISNLEKEEAAMADFIKKNPKIKKLVDSGKRHTTSSEALTRYKNISRVPNFEDYNWKEGVFNSDTIGNPVDKYKEVGGEHHIDRPFSLDNFINFSKGDLKDIVNANDKFKELRKKLT